MSILNTLLKEPPIRRLTQLVVRALPVSSRTKATWNAVERPQYLVGVLHAVDQAKSEGGKAVSVVEFGVAEGYGLLALQRHAAIVENETDVRVDVYGFDAGTGLPEFIRDHRDHPDKWKPGDYPMDEEQLRQQLMPRTRLVIGDVRKTVTQTELAAPLGFVALDLDLYSSTVAALRILERPDCRLLRRIALYFDDTREASNHRWAGELLAIDEFNQASQSIKIDRWRGLRAGRPFPEADWIDGMYLAHHLKAIGQTTLSRRTARMR